MLADNDLPLLSPAQTDEKKNVVLSFSPSHAASYI